MYYRISKNEKILFFGKKNRLGVGSDLNNALKSSLRVLKENGLPYKCRLCPGHTFTDWTPD